MSDTPIHIKIARATNAMHSVSKDASANLGDKIGDVKYATIGAVLNTVKGALQAEGLALLQSVGYVVSDTNLPVMTINTFIIDTETGQSVEFTGPGFPVKGDSQAAGGAMTYYRRYTLVTLFGLIVDDDDAVQATRIDRNPTGRTEAEVEIRRLISDMADDVRKDFIADFKTTFGVGLSDLDSNRHGEALGYTKHWLEPPAVDAGHVTDSDNLPEGA